MKPRALVFWLWMALALLFMAPRVLGPSVVLDAFATASLPTAAQTPAGLVYDVDAGTPRYSDGVRWVPVGRSLSTLGDEMGPKEGFASGAYFEQAPVGAFPTSAIWYTSAAKTAKIVEQTVTYNGNGTKATSVWKVYASDGVTVVFTLSDAYAYEGLYVSSITRTVAP